MKPLNEINTKIINAVNLLENSDFTTVHDLAGTLPTEFVIQVAKKQSARIEFLWGEFTYGTTTTGTDLEALDGTIDLYESIDGENSQPNPNYSTIAMSTVKGFDGFETNLVKSNFLHIKVANGSNTFGTVRILVNLKNL